MPKFYKIIDTKVAAEIAAILEGRIEFVQKWIDYAQKLGFSDARITKGSSCFMELEFKGFTATQEQFHSIDRDIYKFLSNIRGSDFKEYSVWGVRKSNKKAYKEFLASAPCNPSEILTLVDLQAKLLKDYSPIHGVCAAHITDEGIVFSTGIFSPLVGQNTINLHENIAEEIPQSQYLAMQGL